MTLITLFSLADIVDLRFKVDDTTLIHALERAGFVLFAAKQGYKFIFTLIFRKIMFSKISE